MTAQDKVFDCFPDAVAHNVPPVYQHGAEHAADDGYWAVFAGPDRDAEELGRGRSETEAWADAAGMLGNQAA